MTFDQFQNALDIFKLSDRAGLEEIKARHRTLVKRFHPDSGTHHPEKIRKINEAYALLMSYCGNYRFSFTREEFYEQNLQERLRVQFGQEPF